jgi:3-hydroxyacyl-[acyl-carrier-protein] dehydratase
MILKDDFFKIIEQNGNDFLIKLNKNHWIYCAHFPKNPITPGVILIQISSELLQTIVNCKLFLQKIKNLKFIAVVNPEIDEYVYFKFLKIETNENVYNVSVEITDKNHQFAKMNMQLITN